MIKRRTVIATAVLAIVAAALLGFYQPWKTSPPPPSAQIQVRLNAPFPAIDFAPFYVAKTKGWLEESLKASNAAPVYVGAFGKSR